MNERIESDEWMTTAEVAKALRKSVGVVRKMCGDRSRKDAIPAHQVIASERGYRIHPSFIRRESDSPGNQVIQFRSGDQSRIDRLVDAIRELQTQNLALATENLQLKAAANLRDLALAS